MNAVVSRSEDGELTLVAHRCITAARALNPSTLGPLLDVARRVAVAIEGTTATRQGINQCVNVVEQTSQLAMLFAMLAIRVAGVATVYARELLLPLVEPSLHL